MHADEIADAACSSLTRKARALASQRGTSDPIVTLFLDVAAIVQRERARVHAGEPYERARGPIRERAPVEPLPAPVVEVGPPEELPVTGRELELIRCLAAGMSVNESARALHITANTVKTLQRRAATRLGVRNHAGALVHAASALLNDAAPHPERAGGC